MGILEHEEVEQHYIETFAYHLINTYINSASLDLHSASTSSELVRAATRVEPAEYEYTYHFDNGVQHEIFTDMASFTFFIDGYISGDGIYDTLSIENLELNFADKFYRINCEKINKVILTLILLILLVLII